VSDRLPIPADSIALSNGYGQFHLQDLAAYLDSIGALETYLSGVHLRVRPPRAVSGSRVMGGAVARMLQRRVDLSSAAIRRAWCGEALHQVGRRAIAGGLPRLGGQLEAGSLRAYGHEVTRRVSASRAPIYHYRAGFGNVSLPAARRSGAVLLCDHSIAHPRYLARVLPAMGAGMTAFWRLVEQDIEQADHVVVNSGFVKDTCVAEGMSPESITVVPTVPDGRILDHLGVGGERSGRPIALFVGSLEYRKGVRALVDAVVASQHLELDWVVVGDWEPEAAPLRSLIEGKALLLDRLPRAEVATWLAKATFFVFPTLAEGSARVVAEALHAGCHVVTTHNAGSLTRDGVDGRIVPAEDSAAIVAALEEGLALPPAERGRRARETSLRAREVLTPEAYASGIVQLYARLLGTT
jgi:glycosyltransferase involved in cell wall biosynthesis